MPRKNTKNTKTQSAEQIPTSGEVIFKPNPGPQTDFLASSEQEILFGGAAGGGKVLYEHQNILTPEGWKNCKDLNLGDVICHPNGKTQTIKHLFAWEVLDVWEVELDDGTVYETAQEHLWNYWLAREGPSKSKVKSTKEMSEETKTPIIPTISKVFLKNKPVEVDPYFLGCILGDGCIVNKSVGFSVHKSDWPHFKKEFNLSEYREEETCVYLKGKTRKNFVEYLKKVGLFGKKSNSKFVPENYLWNSEDVRLSILQGLMDTDGYRDKGRARAEFSTVSKKLADNVKFLSQSLGYRVSTYEKIGSYKNELNEKVICQKVYRLYITGQDVDKIFRLQRKKIGVIGKQLGRRVVDIRKTNRKATGRCITVSEPDGLYISDDFVVTHNSYVLVADPMRYFNNPHFQGLMLRRSTEELRELIRISKKLYPAVFKGAKFVERDKTWYFPSGATMWMSYLDRDDDVLRYQGQAYSWIGFDELTQWPTPHPWQYLSSRLRTSEDSGLPLCQRATTNPGGPGHCVPFGEVLTKNGWVDIRKIKKGDVVVSVDSNKQQKYVEVSDTVKEFYEGNMVYYKDQMIFTENHRLPLKTNSGFEIRPFYDLPGQSNILRSAFSMSTGVNQTFTVPKYKTRWLKLKQPDTISAIDYAELMGWFLSEGHTLDRDKEFGISQTKEPQRSKIKKLLTDCGFKFRESSTGFQVSSPKWWNYFKQFGNCRKKFIPRNLMDSFALKHFFRALMAGDGHWDSYNSGTYYTISEQLANDVQEVCIRLGYTTSLYSRQRENRQGLSYEVRFTGKKDSVELNTGNHIYKVTTENSRVNCNKSYFEGFVYCLVVPETETFFIRQNGYVWLSGNSWVKKMFIDPAPPNTSFWATDIETGKVLTWPENHSDPEKAGKPLFKRRFIPSKLADNPYLYSDGKYEANLLSLPEAKRLQLLEGSWDMMEGAAFPEWNREIHVIEPFDIPRTWTRFRAADYGYNDSTVVVWFAVAPNNQLIVYRELKVNKTTAEDLAELILEAEAGERIAYGVLDSSVWSNRGESSISIADQMIMRGVKWRKSDRSKGSRVSRKNELHARLKVNEYTEEPGIVFFNTCLACISEIPMIPLDKNNPEDVDTKAEDHAYDAITYGIATRPMVRDFRSGGRLRTGFQAADPVFGG